MEKVLVKMTGTEKFKAAKKIMAVTNKIVHIVEDIYNGPEASLEKLYEIYDAVTELKRLMKKYKFDVNTAVSMNFDDEIEFITECGLNGKFDTIDSEESEVTENA